MSKVAKHFEAERDQADAPAHYGHAEACAWAAGWNAAVEAAQRNLAARQELERAVFDRHGGQHLTDEEAQRLGVQPHPEARRLIAEAAIADEYVGADELERAIRERIEHGGERCKRCGKPLAVDDRLAWQTGYCSSECYGLDPR